MNKISMTKYAGLLRILAATMTCSLLVSTASACFVEGSVFCTESLSCPATPTVPLLGVVVTATGDNGDVFTGVTGFSGSYHIDLPTIKQNYTLTINMQALCPASGQIVTLVDPDVNGGDVVSGLDFQVQGVCTAPPGQGCPAKFWKDNKGKWVGYIPDTVINQVFGNATKQVCNEYGDDGKKHFKDAIGWGTSTGNLKDAFHNLLREAVAALLNAANPQVNYPLTEAQIVLLVNDVLATCDRSALITLANDLKAANSLGSPLCTSTGTADCTTDGKPNNLTLTYTSGSCASAVNSQPLGQKYNCSESNGGLTGVSPVRIIASSSSSVPTATSSRFFDGTVALGDSFDVHGSLGANTYFFIYEGGVLKQFVQMHTSCSAPLIRGESFGGLVLTDYAIIP